MKKDFNATIITIMIKHELNRWGFFLQETKTSSHTPFIKTSQISRRSIARRGQSRARQTGTADRHTTPHSAQLNLKGAHMASE